MSADNWSICPKCVKNRTQELEKKKAEIVKNYGKVSSEEYFRLIDSLKKEEVSCSFETKEVLTLREDYEIGISENGEFSVGYSCSCSTCAFLFRFKHKEVVKWEEDDHKF